MHNVGELVIEGRPKNFTIFLLTQNVHLHYYWELHSGGVVHVHLVREEGHFPNASEVGQALMRLGPLCAESWPTPIRFFITGETGDGFLRLSLFLLNSQKGLLPVTSE